eukprot:m.24885 g.24885  ORF g.24885 m.24885 type:complete len:389 (-) comp9145_c0_seq1:211-1377(-)
MTSKLTDYFGRRRKKLSNNSSSSCGAIVNRNESENDEGDGCNDKVRIHENCTSKSNRLVVVSSSNICSLSNTTISKSSATSATEAKLSATTVTLSSSSSLSPTTTKKPKLCPQKEEKVTQNNNKRKKTQNRLVQSYLDFGQKSSLVQCSECGMPYHSNVKSDKETHKKYHQAFLAEEMEGVKLSMNIKGLVSDTVDMKETLHGRNVLVISNTKSLSANFKRKLQRVFNVMEKTLGLCKNSIPLQKSEKVYLHVVDKTIISCAVTACGVSVIRKEGLKEQSKRSSSRNSSSSQSASSCSHSTSPRTPITKVPLCKLGICFLWVAPSYRREGIASELIDVARRNTLLDEEVPASEVAFSDPSDEGSLFAKTYTGTKDFLIFNALDALTLN